MRRTERNFEHNTDREGTEREIGEFYSKTNTSAGGEYMGKTKYGDEFGTEEKGHIRVHVFCSALVGTYGLKR